MKVIATTFMVAGVLGIVDVVTAAVQGRLSLDLAVFGVLIGRGLWRLNPVARWFALAGLWVNLVGILLLVVLACVFFWARVNTMALVSVTLLWSFLYWQIRTLHSDDRRYTPTLSTGGSGPGHRQPDRAAVPIQPGFIARGDVGRRPRGQSLQALVAFL
ncbi:MAG TPA: hypothetical protein VHC22_31290 [Pirellulales bacterium]|nr:hypothetical protein [Pirellulales bacterium]